MALTAREALDHVRHALSADKMPSIGGLRILNDAGEYLVNMHPWRWLEGEQVSLSLLPDQPFIWLPENVHSINALVSADTINANVTLTTAQELARRRASTINTSFHYWAALVYAQRGTKKRLNYEFTDGYNGAPQTVVISDSSRVVTFHFNSIATPGSSPDTENDKYGLGDAASAKNTAIKLVKAINDADLMCRAEYAPYLGEGGLFIESRYAGRDDSDNWDVTEDVANLQEDVHITGTQSGPPMPRLDLWPTPATHEQNAFVAYYRRGWTPLRNDDDAVSVPTWCEALYLALVRNVALGYERDAEGDVATRLGNVRNSGLFGDARRRDSYVQQDFGPMQNGAAQFDYGLNDQMWNFDQTGGPL